MKIARELGRRISFFTPKIAILRKSQSLPGERGKTVSHPGTVGQKILKKMYKKELRPEGGGSETTVTRGNLRASFF